MGLFDKKYCDICGDKIGMLGNRKLEDGNMCKDCAKKLSPLMTERRKMSVEDIKDHLNYREQNQREVAQFQVTRTLGCDYTKLLIDENAKKFLVTKSNHWQNENPDVIAFDQVTGCQTEIEEIREELWRKNEDGGLVRYNPPRYDIDYDFHVTIHVNSPYFSEIKFDITGSNVKERHSVEYQEAERQMDEIRKVFDQMHDELRENRSPKAPGVCETCGATTVPDAKGCCEYCGSVM